MFKEYKSVGEVYVNYEMSFYMRELIEGLLMIFLNCFSEVVIECCGVLVDDFEIFLVCGVLNMQQFLDVGFVDECGFFDEVQVVFEEQMGCSFECVFFNGYLMLFGLESCMGCDCIVVVFGEGVIVILVVEVFLLIFGMVGFLGLIVVCNLCEVVEDLCIKVIILCVDSFGGVVVGLNLVLYEVE